MLLDLTNILTKFVAKSWVVSKPVLSKGSINPALNPIATTFLTQSFSCMPTLISISLKVQLDVS